ncbi:hypothetical protein ACOSQ4_012960 [Xanthoceras sorbifolium]
MLAGSQTKKFLADARRFSTKEGYRMLAGSRTKKVLLDSRVLGQKGETLRMSSSGRKSLHVVDWNGRLECSTRVVG